MADVFVEKIDNIYTELICPLACAYRRPAQQ